MENQEKISVIIPVYNVEKYIERCVRSVMDQTYRNLEIICVNDGSPDGSPAILERLKKEDDRIVVLDKENGGLGDARNFGLGHASSEWVSFIDSDDFIQPDTYEKIAPAFVHNPDIIHFGLETMYDGISPIAEDARYFAIADEGLYEIDDEAIRKTHTVVCNKMFRKSILDKHGIRFESLRHEDDIFVTQYVMVSRTVYYIKDKLYNYVRRGGSIMASAFEGSPKAIEALAGFNCTCRFAMRWENEIKGCRNGILAEFFPHYYLVAIQRTTHDKVDDIVNLALGMYKEYPFLHESYDVDTGDSMVKFIARRKNGRFSTRLFEYIFSVKKDWYAYRLCKIVRIFNVPVYRKIVL